MQSSSGQSRVVSAILKASKKGGELANCGVMGRLGDLDTPSKRNTMALSPLPAVCWITLLFKRPQGHRSASNVFARTICRS